MQCSGPNGASTVSTGHVGTDPAERLRKSRSWVRSGCSKCKQRRKKCDEVKPSHADFRTSFWAWIDRAAAATAYASGFPAIMILYGRRRPHRRTNPCGRRRLALSADKLSPGQVREVIFDSPVTQVNRSQRGHNESNAIHEIINTGYEDTSQPGRASFTCTPGPPSAMSLAAGPICSHYLMYYTSHLSRLLVMVDTPLNPLRNMVIPRMATSPMLLKAVCAVSACHLTRRQDTATVWSDATRTFAIRNYSQALRSLTNALSEYGTCERSAWCSVDQIVLTAVFLCKYEIIRGSTKEWRHHLTGLIQLMMHPVTALGLSLEARRYLQSYITYHCEVAAITSDSSRQSHHPMFSSRHGPPLQQSFSAASTDDECASNDKDEIDTYMGFAKSIVGLFGRISQLSCATNAQDVIREALSIYQTLLSWSIFDQKCLAPHGVPLSSIQYLQSAALAYHSSAVIYFHSITAFLAKQIVHQTTSSVDPQFIPMLWPWLGMDTALSKQAAVIRCFEALGHIPDGMPSESSLVLPLFIMGCESDFPEQQSYAIDRLRQLENSVGLGNISRARVVVEQVKKNAVVAAAANKGWMAETEGPGWSRATDSLGWDLIVT